MWQSGYIVSFLFPRLADRKMSERQSTAVQSFLLDWTLFEGSAGKAAMLPVEAKAKAAPKVRQLCLTISAANSCHSHSEILRPVGSCGKK